MKTELIKQNDATGEYVLMITFNNLKEYKKWNLYSPEKKQKYLDLYRTPKHYDWTKKNGRSNSSDNYLELVDVVDELIKDSAHALIRGESHFVAGLIMAQLVHKYHLIPSKK